MENVKELWEWEQIEAKLVDFQNQGRFFLRCLSNDVIPVSVRLKCSIKTIRGYYIVKRVERQLSN